ncbi:unnamed protein product, partial [Pylaiella littoralis]
TAPALSTEGGDDAPEDGTEQGGVRRAQVPQVPGCQRLKTEAQIRVVGASVKQMELGGVGLLGVRHREASS